MQGLAELNDAIDALLRRLSQKDTLNEGLEWYLQNNLNQYKRALQSATGRQDIENATRAFNRFCIDSMDFDTDLFRECSAIGSLGAKVAKALR